MRRAAALGGAFAALVALAPACLGPGDFTCHTSEQCGAGAFCETDNRCSTFDATCASRRRYLPAAGPESSACVTATCGDNPLAALAAGGSASCVRRSDGHVLCWGRNDDGQLGDGTVTPRSTAVEVLGLHDATAIAVGARHACAVRAGNTVACWGADDTGQLGDGGGADQRAPVAVPGVANATAVAAGDGFSCALLADRTVVCWGGDGEGELGDGAPSATPRGPTPVLGLGAVKSLAAHWQHTCAILADETLACWGNNASGQLGDGTTSNRSQPTAVAGLTNVVAVATGLSHTCAMFAGGIRCWGSNSEGQIGVGTMDATAPVTQPALVSIVDDPVAIDAGAQHTCVVRVSGQVYCWGQNSAGQLGDGSMSSIPEPVPVSGLGGAARVATGATFSCATTRDGAVFCWGDDHYGQLGDGHDVVRSLPVTVGVSGDGVAAGGAHTCAVSRGSGADAFVCWGSDQAGQLGDNGEDDRGLPAALKEELVPGAVAAGAQHTCALDAAGALWCWGRGSSGQLGPGHLVDTPVPTQVTLAAGAQATAVDDGDAHTCALAASADGLGGEVFCFGDNTYGQLGDGTTTSRPVPGLAALGAAGARAAAVSAGGGHTCALDVDGGAWCWGRGDSGQLGLGAAADTPAPAPVALPGGAPVAAISAGSAHTCAVDRMGGVWCWGADDRGQLGLGATGADDVTAPAAVAGLPAPATGVAAGGVHSCATLADASVWCWGGNDSGQLGDGTTLDRPFPAQVAGATGVVTAGALHTCASAGETIACWGADTSGQLGDGVTLTVSAPALARVPCD